MWKKRHFDEPLEMAYKKIYGQEPFDHLADLRKKYGSEKASEILQKNMDSVWLKEKQRNGYVGQGFFLTEKTGATVPFDK